MANAIIYQIPTLLPGSVGILPLQKYAVVGDTLAAVTTANYFNTTNLESAVLSTDDVLNLFYNYNPNTHVGTYEQFSIAVNGTGVITLSALSAAGSVTLPTIANHLATFTNTTGHLGEDPATAISGGNIQAGLSGTAGTLASFPTTAAKGSLVVAAVANTGNTLTTISNAAMGQASVVSIPDPGVATSSFILADSAGTQTIATGNLTLTAGNLTLTAGNISATAGTISAPQGNIAAGSSGHAGTVGSFPAVAAEGELLLAAVSNATGNFNTTISNAAAVAQSQVISIPDSGATTGNFIISGLAGGGVQHITTGSLQVDAGSVLAGKATGGTAGGLQLFPATASNGSLILTPVGNAGNFATTISPVSTLGQASVFTLPDPGGATSNIAVTGGALVSGNIPKASGVAGVLVDSGFSPVFGAAAGVPYTAIVTMATAAVVGAFGTPVQIIAAPGAAFTIMVLNAQVITETSTAFATGGVAQIQYGNTVHAGGTICTSATIPAAEITAAASQIYTMAPIAAATVMATASFKNLGIFFSNATGAFTNGAGSTITIAISYMIIPSV